MDLAPDYGAPYSNPEYLEGQEAGWRGDEIVTPKSLAFQQGFEIGQVARMQHDERTRRICGGD